jgi:hypothetical protein
MRPLEVEFSLFLRLVESPRSDCRRAMSRACAGTIGLRIRISRRDGASARCRGSGCRTPIRPKVCARRRGSSPISSATRRPTFAGYRRAVYIIKADLANRLVRARDCGVLPGRRPRRLSGYAKRPNRTCASAISGISGVGERPSSAGARIAWASPRPPVDW